VGPSEAAVPSSSAPVHRGRARTLWTLSRPRLQPFVLGLVVLGFAQGHWVHAAPLTGARDLVGALMAWWGLSTATLWWNAALDRDEGEVLLGESVAPPEGIEGAAGLLFGLSVAFGMAIGPVVGGLALLCAGLGWAYSTPRGPWKAHPVLGPLVNVVGYGVISPLVGRWVMGAPFDPREPALGAAIALGVWVTFLVAQCFQGPEDRARGYRTMVATAGGAAVLRAARAGVLAIAVVLAGLVGTGWLPQGVVLLLPSLAWVVAGLQVQGEPTVQVALTYARRAGLTVALGILVLLGHYVVESFRLGPVAGQAWMGI